mmetsp:Transcript_38332/g.73441  ORF Transcript_38332/g.73441 Transcript_38332/m.73441 type:complete len:230 (-) Transcript_38332:1689-2378(-)
MRRVLGAGASAPYSCMYIAKMHTSAPSSRWNSRSTLDLYGNSVGKLGKACPKRARVSSFLSMLDTSRTESPCAVSTSSTGFSSRRARSSRSRDRDSLKRCSRNSVSLVRGRLSAGSCAWDRFTTVWRRPLSMSAFMHSGQWNTVFSPSLRRPLNRTHIWWCHELHLSHSTHASSSCSSSFLRFSRLVLGTEPPSSSTMSPLMSLKHGTQHRCLVTSPAPELAACGGLAT